MDYFGPNLNQTNPLIVSKPQTQHPALVGKGFRQHSGLKNYTSLAVAVEAKMKSNLSVASDCGISPGGKQAVGGVAGLFPVGKPKHVEKLME